MQHRTIFVLLTLGLLVLFSLSACGEAGSGTGLPTGTVIPQVIYVVATPTATPTSTLTPRPTRTPLATATPLPSATPFITPPAPGESAVIPILMYHHLNALNADASVTLKTWTVDPAQFEAQLDYLQGRGFHTITLAQLAQFFDNGESLPEHPIVLTFDDGWKEDYTVAYPDLKKRGMVGVFFPPTNYAQAGGELLMDWDQVLELDKAGMEIGSHTINHADLTTANLDEARRQLVVSKQILEEKLGHPVEALSYPFGSYNPKIVAETQAAGYRTAVILCCGYKQSSDMMLLLPRIRISFDDSLDEIAKRLPKPDAGS